MRLILLLLGLTTATLGNAASHTLAGDEIDAGMYFGLERISGFQLDHPFIVLDGSSDQKRNFSGFTLDVDGDKFSIKYSSASTVCSFCPPGSNALRDKPSTSAPLSYLTFADHVFLRLSDLDFLPTNSTLSSLTIDTNIDGYTLKVGTDAVNLGLGGTNFSSETYFIGHFNVSRVSAVPEPPQWAFMLTGFLGIMLFRKRYSI